MKPTLMNYYKIYNHNNKKLFINLDQLILHLEICFV